MSGRGTVLRLPKGSGSFGKTKDETMTGSLSSVEHSPSSAFDWKPLLLPRNANIFEAAIDTSSTAEKPRAAHSTHIHKRGLALLSEQRIHPPKKMRFSAKPTRGDRHQSCRPATMHSHWRSAQKSPRASTLRLDEERTRRKVPSRSSVGYSVDTHSGAMLEGPPHTSRGQRSSRAILFSVST